MQVFLSKISKVLITLLILGVLIFAFSKTPTYKKAETAFFQKVIPCQKAITYNVGDFDEDFGISQEEFLHAIAEAENIWETPIQKDLFSYSPNKAVLKINLQYDYRQQITDKLKSLGITLNGDQKSYNALKTKYQSMYAEYVTLKANLDADYANYQNREASYNAEVQKWNSQGGAPKNEVAKLNAQRASLDAQATRIKSEQDELNTLVANVNTLSTSLNQLASELNLKVKDYNQIGAEAGSEFEEGLYKSDASGQEIDIYQYDDHTKLVRVLTHELGHALGMEHVEDPKAIMYKLNEGADSQLTQSDISELKRVCKME
jgi:chromosome segregation ATPase